MRRRARLLYDAMCDRVRQSKMIHTDEPMPVQKRFRDRIRTGRIWVYLSDANSPYTDYDATPSRSRDGPQAFLKGFDGYSQADAVGGYDRLHTTRTTDTRYSLSRASESPTAWSRESAWRPIALGSSPDRILEIVRQGANTRMPVYDRELDSIVGDVNTKDLFYLFSLKGVVILRRCLVPASILEAGR